MKISNPLIRGFYSGLIAGVIAGIPVTIARIIQAMLELPTEVPGILSLETIVYHISYEMGQVGIFGAIFGIFYSRFYLGLPSKGVKKGFIFGLIVGFFSNIWWTSANFLKWLLTGNVKFLWWSFEFAYSYIAIFPLYGIILGVVYKR